MTDDKIEIVELKARPALAVKAIAKSLSIPKVMGDAYQKIKSRIDDQNLAGDETDMPFCIYCNLDWGIFDEKGLVATFKMLFTRRWYLELGIPTARPAQESAGLLSIETPTGRHIKAIHMGPYMKVDEAYSRIRGYAAAHGHDLKNYSIEIYTNDPTTVAKKNIRTEVYAPIA
jgi:effector-binding domain-containing protein